jgi:hypothetical protein
MRRIAALGTVWIGLLAAAGVAEANPSFATNTNNDCSVCHSNSLTGRMSVVDEDSINDLGTQLDGTMPGPLKTFEVMPGSIVPLSVRVLDGSDKFAVQLKRLETGGQLVDMSDFLVWSEANDAGNVWTLQEVNNPPYFTKDAGNNQGITFTEPTTYVFDLMVDASTPHDFYDLEFMVAGKSSADSLWSQGEHFYVEVLPEPAAALQAIAALGIVAALARRRRAGSARPAPPL